MLVYPCFSTAWWAPNVELRAYMYVANRSESVELSCIRAAESIFTPFESVANILGVRLRHSSHIRRMRKMRLKASPRAHSEPRVRVSNDVACDVP